MKNQEKSGEKLLSAAVGEYSMICLFGAAGITTKEASTSEQAEKVVASLVQEGFKIIFLSEKLALQMPETLEKYRSSAFPVILPIPDKDGKSLYGAENLHKNMEKAIGTDIFLGN